MSNPTPSQLISDLTSPYFLTLADNPGTILVPDLLNGENYAAWKRSMRMALNAKNKFVFVDGTLKKPSDTEVANLWDRCSDMVLSWLLNSIDRHLRQSLIYCTKPSDVWADLENRFSQSNHPRLYRLQRDLANLKQNNMPVTTYYNTIKGMWDEITALIDPNPCTCDARKRTEDNANTEQLFQFLMGLNDTFSNVHSQILAMDPLPTISRAYATVHQEETQRLLQVPLLPTLENSAMAVGRTRTPITNGPRPRTGRKCTKCGRDGHQESSCFEIIGYPPHWNTNKPKQPIRTNHGSATQRSHTANLVSNDPIPSSSSAIPRLSNEQYRQLMELLQPSTNIASVASANSFSGNHFSIENSPLIGQMGCVIDSGASAHVSSLSNLKWAKNVLAHSQFLTLPTGYKAQVTHMGQIPISPHLCLHSVLFVPNFNYNLISISQLTKSSNCIITFFLPLVYFRTNTRGN